MDTVPADCRQQDKQLLPIVRVPFVSLRAGHTNCSWRMPGPNGSALSFQTPPSSSWSKMRKRMLGLGGLPCNPRHTQANQRIVIRNLGSSGVSMLGFESSSVTSKLFISHLLYPQDYSNSIGVTGCEVSRNY